MTKIKPNQEQKKKAKHLNQGGCTNQQYGRRWYCISQDRVIKDNGKILSNN